MDLEASIQALREALAGDERVSAAILFGSAARGTARRSSDLDVALLARSPADAAELRASELEIGARLSAAAGREVHVVLLDGVEPVLGRQVFAGGRKLVERDAAHTARTLERILMDYFDGEYHRRIRAEALERRRAARHG